MTHGIHGIIPPMTTPFNENGTVDDPAIRAQVDFLLDAGVHGLAAAGSTGEGHTLETNELRRVAAETVDAAAGHVPVIAGIIADSTRDAITRASAVADVGVAALQVTPVHYLFRPDDDAMLDHFRAIAESTALPVIIYNVVPWSYLSPDLLVKIMAEVPGVIGVKQSAGDLKLFADLMVLRGPDDLILCAVDALMYPAYSLGAHGSIAAILTAAPAASVALWDAVAAGDHKRARRLHESLLRLWNVLVADNLPANVKTALTLQGCPGGWPRAPMPPSSPEQISAIREALAALNGVGGA